MRKLKRDHDRLRAMLRDLEAAIERRGRPSEAPVAYLAMPASAGVAALTGDNPKTAGEGTTRVFKRDENEQLYDGDMDTPIFNAWGEIPSSHVMLIIRATTGEWWPIAPEVDIGVLEDDLTYRSYAGVTLWGPDDDEELGPNGGTIIAHAWGLAEDDVIEQGTEVFVRKVGRRWYVDGAACTAAAGGGGGGGSSIAAYPSEDTHVDGWEVG